LIPICNVALHGDIQKSQLQEVVFGKENVDNTYEASVRGKIKSCVLLFETCKKKAKANCPCLWKKRC